MSGIKSLVKDTAIYGISSIVGRLLNYLLFPFYTHVFAPGQYGVVSNLYSYSGVLLVLLTYGMETGFFRFANRRDKPMTVYTTVLISLAATSLFFLLALTVFARPISAMIGEGTRSSLVLMVGVITAIDAFSSIPFAYLRFKKKAKTYAAIKLVNVVATIALNVFFLMVCPKIVETHPGMIDGFYNRLGGTEFGVGWVFVANLLASGLMMLLLLPQLRGLKWRFDGLLLRRMLKFSFPILITGVVGTFAHNMGQIMIPFILSDDPAKAHSMVGLYSAGVKVSVILSMFTQAFRLAFEPFIFSGDHTDIKARNQSYCDALKYFVAFSLLIFMVVNFSIPLFKHISIFGRSFNLISAEFWPGLSVVPLMMGAEICFSVYSNLCIWCKLTDRTAWNSFFSIIAFVVMAILNIMLVPRMGYEGSAWAALISYAVVMILSWIIGQFYFPLHYQVGRMLKYAIVAIGFTLCCEYIANVVGLIAGTTLKIIAICAYIIIIIRTEKIQLTNKSQRA